MKAPNKRKLTDQFIKSLSSQKRTLVWDTKLGGLALAVYPTGKKVFKCIYAFGGRTRWYTIGRADAIDLDSARRLAAQVLLKVATDVDPQAERSAQRSRGTFEELSASYVEQYAKKKNKAWAQSDKLVRKHLIPKWGKLQAAAITRSDVKAAMAAISSESVANQTLAAASAIFSWAIREEIAGAKVNPCKGVERNEEVKRERVLSDSEVPLFWAAFDNAGLIASAALKAILLLGQRPGEVTRMRREHMADGWWTLPGKPVPELGWLGTKNAQTHRVWIPEAVRELIDEIDPSATTGFVFATRRGNPVKLEETMRAICSKLGAERLTPHDLRRTHGSTVTGLRFGRDAMNRIQNHREGGVTDVYDRHSYKEENREIMEAVANRIISLVSGDEGENVIQARFAR
jgi:integrase